MTQKIQALMALFTAFPAQDKTGAEDELAQIYLMALEGIGDESVTKAVRMFINGMVERGNHTFRPTPPELAKEARRLDNGRLRREDSLRRVEDRRKRLPAPPRPPEAERAKHVLEELGYDPTDENSKRAFLRETSFVQMCQKHGLTRDQVEKMSEGEVLSKLVDKSKPWWNESSESAKASSRRIRDSLITKGLMSG